MINMNRNENEGKHKQANLLTDLLISFPFMRSTQRENRIESEKIEIERMRIYSD